MATESTAAPYVPDRGGLRALEEASRGCRGCDLYRAASQTVFGAGPAPARLMFIGEQPGDREDLEGEPFVGPAGRLLDRALGDAGIDRSSAYLTNVVKHFKFVREERGKRRIHQKPNAAEIRACRPWLTAELQVVRPEIVVCLGATAAKSLLGSSFSVTADRGVLLDFPDVPELGSQRPRLALATVHPSSVVRAPDRRSAFQGLLADLEVVARA
ncbi:DNA polymerase [Saccharopolyspora antimicrobica]|uniref:Type-4 uracil-DNA glycosylase n=1 Tax=Saccharopolyspora antimicrobica TaxID=455193 RepID=A0A1I4RUZ3_9PSEU|nr:UdgX family uracil-DNA binding protein [Saccharopolyspora antimicrobica]RKT89151.1 DNA polymerase [Saccharopolyspora antimicrobica]SFM55894.1 DNA polymerase [Saccharopolyspora antimicrobica]